MAKQRHLIAVQFFKDAKYTPKNHVPKTDDGTTYHYYHTEEIEVGRFVVVPAGDGYRQYGPFSIGIVVKGDPSESAMWSGLKLKNIIDVIDDTELRRQQRMEEIQAELKSRSEQLDELYRYKMLAEVDPAAKAMLEELQEMAGLSILPSLPTPTTPPAAPTAEDVQVLAPEKPARTRARRTR